MINVNLNTLSSEELVRTAQNMINEYETKKVTGAYGGTNLSDIQALERNLQRAVFEGNIIGDQRPKQLHDKVKTILESDAGVKFNKITHTLKTKYQLELEHNKRVFEQSRVYKNVYDR